MAAKSNSNEGGTDTTTITTGNSGGASGDAWSTVTVTTAAITFSVDHAAHGTLSMKIANVASPTSTRTDWTGVGGGSADIWFRHYLYMAANPSASFIHAGVRDTAAGLCAQMSISTTGKVEIA